MNKAIKMFLLAFGAVLLIYGLYTLITPETSIAIGNLKIEAQDNTNSYITIGIGLVTVLGSFLGGKKM